MAESNGVQSRHKPRLTVEEVQKLEELTCDRLTEELKKFSLTEDTLRVLQNADITGTTFFQLRPRHLKACGIKDEQKQILFEIISFKTLQRQKIFLDPLYGHIYLHPLLVRLIDTPEIQRLRDIKQLGGAYRIFPGASHNRFEHSIGSCYLAGLVGKTLQKREPSLISDKDILCLQIAALCHELGQGPFSRLFDQFVVPYVQCADGANTGSYSPRRDHWVRRISAQWIPDFLRSNGLEDDFVFYGLSMDRDVRFIQMLIYQVSQHVEQEGDLVSVGREKENVFLFEIVSNRKNEIDVDRWDYMARDCLCTGLKNGFDYQKLLTFMRVVTDESGSRVIAFRDKVVMNIQAMFRVRHYLYRAAYLHLPTMVVELMIADAFRKVSDKPILSCEEPDRKFSINDAIEDTRNGSFKKYRKLTDSLYYLILFSTDPALQAGRKVLERIEKRDFYHLVGQSVPRAGKSPWDCNSILETEDQCKKTLLTKSKKYDEGKPLSEDCLLIKVFQTGLVVNDEHPRTRIPFFTKAGLVLKEDKVPKHMVDLDQSQEWQIRVFYTGSNREEFGIAKKAFQDYCANMLLTVSDSKAELPPEIKPLHAIRHGVQPSGTDDGTYP